MNSDPRLIGSDIYVSILDGKVILSGVVPSQEAKLIAEDNVYMVPQVMFVENFLKVKELKGQHPGEDHMLLKEIYNCIHQYTYFAEDLIDIDVLKGCVSLTGKVDFYWKKLLVERIIKSKDGVQKIENKLTVCANKKVIDEIIGRRIMIQLLRNKSLTTENLSISVQDGIVSVKGTIFDLQSREEILCLLSSICGVNKLRDEMVLAENDFRS
jgi:osmotically-inducible protein OsmY